MFLFIYADDTVILSYTQEGLQEALLQLQTYCDKWSLDVHINKKEIVIFSKRKHNVNNFVFQ